MRTITIEQYNPNWVLEYEKEAKQITDILKEELVRIHHIGSTSIPNLPAKPVIDILLEVRSLDNLTGFRDSFEKIGYECLGEYGIPARYFFRKGGENPTHHIHAYEQENTYEINRHLAVRDFLKKNELWVEEYAKLKVRLAKQFPHSIEDYCEGKDNFVKELEKTALDWYLQKD